MGQAAHTAQPNTTRARALRRDITKFESLLWRELQDLNRHHGTHFRRQSPIGRFIADFCEHTRKLVIEVDGRQHDEPEQAAHDAERTVWLASQGYHVIRFTNSEVAQTLEGVVTEIMAAADILRDDSSIAVDNPQTLRATSSKTRARIQRQNVRVARREKKDTPSPNPSPQGGGGFASTAMVSKRVEMNDGLAPSVPSPLVGEGQGGGYRATDANDGGIAS